VVVGDGAVVGSPVDRAFDLLVPATGFEMPAASELALYGIQASGEAYILVDFLVERRPVAYAAI
jgi:hypothetical protein